MTSKVGWPKTSIHGPGETIEELRTALALFEAFHEALIGLDVPVDSEAMDKIHREYKRMLPEDNNLNAYDFFEAFQEVIGKALKEKLEGLEKLEIMALERQAKGSPRPRKSKVSVSA